MTSFEQHAASDTSLAKAARILWFGLFVLISLLFLYDGAGFAYGGARLAVGPAYEQLRQWPGIRPHGVILLALAALLIFSVGRRVPFWPLVLTVLYSTLVTFTFFASWVTTGVVVWASPSKWLFLIAPGSLLLAVTYVLTRGEILRPIRDRTDEPRGRAGAV